MYYSLILSWNDCNNFSFSWPSYRLRMQIIISNKASSYLNNMVTQTWVFTWEVAVVLIYCHSTLNDKVIMPHLSWFTKKIAKNDLDFLSALAQLKIMSYFFDPKI